MNEYSKYTVPVPMPKNAFQNWANQYQVLQEEFTELQIAASGYSDAIEIIDRIKNL